MPDRSRARAIALVVLMPLLMPLTLALAACGSEPQLQPLAPDAVILAFGDSLTRGTGAAQGAGYPEVLAQRTGLRVINDGVPGEVSGRGLQRLESSLATHEPALVVLVHGGNDMLRRQPASDTRANLERMVELIRARGAQVVMLGVPGPSLTLAAPDFYAEVADAAAVPIDLATLPGLIRDSSMKSDQVHFNGAGYARMAAAVEELLRESGALP